MVTLRNIGQLKLADEVCKLTSPLTNEREGRFRVWKSPVISTLPLTDFRDGNSIDVSLGFLATIKSDPTVVRSGNANELRVG